MKNKYPVTLETAVKSQASYDRKCNAPGTLCIVIGLGGTPVRIKFGPQTLSQKDTSHAHKWGRKMLMIAAKIGRSMAKERLGHSLEPADLELLNGEEAQGFRTAILDRWHSKKKDPRWWFRKLFGNVMPFVYVNEVVSWSMNGQGAAIKRVVLQKDTEAGESCDSTTSPPADFEQIIATSRAAHANWVSAIGESMEQEAKEFLEQTGEVALSTTRPLEVALGTLAKYKGKEELPSFDMHLISLIHPQRWCSVHDYGETGLSHQIQALATKAAESATPRSRRHRRIHVVSRAVEDQVLNLLYLADAMLGSLRRHIDSRALLVDRMKIEYRSGVPMIKGTLLMDCGAFSMKGGNHGVIITNERPYFESGEEDERTPMWGVYPIPPQHERACYYFLRHNFQKLWNASEDYPVRVWRIPKILRKLAALLDEETPEGWNSRLVAIRDEARFNYFDKERVADLEYLRDLLLNLAPPAPEGDLEDEDADELDFMTAFISPRSAAKLMTQ